MLGLVAAASALMSTLLIHRLGMAVKKMVGERLYTMKTLKGRLSTTSSRCKICTNINRAEIESLVKERGLEYVLKVYPELSRRSLMIHMRGHKPEQAGELDIHYEMRQLVGMLKELYARLELFDDEYLSDENGITPKDYLNSIGERLDIISKIKDLLISMEKVREPASQGEIDLSELLRSLKEP